MKAKIEIEMNNAAFAEMGHASELARILRALAHEVEHNGETGCPLHDITGNTVGKFEVLP